VGFLDGVIELFECANPTNPTVSTRPTRSPEPSEPIGLRMVNGYDMSKPNVVGYGEILPPNPTRPTRAHPFKFEKKKKKLVGVYKFKKCRFVKVPTLIFVSNPYVRLKKKKIKEDKSINNYIKYPKQSKIITFTINNTKKANNILKAQK
jgi:hypothetical protein